jgi:hypothetical protein
MSSKRRKNEIKQTAKKIVTRATGTKPRSEKPQTAIGGWNPNNSIFPVTITESS